MIRRIVLVVALVVACTQVALVSAYNLTSLPACSWTCMVQNGEQGCLETDDEAAYKSCVCNSLMIKESNVWPSCLSSRCMGSTVEWFQKLCPGSFIFTSNMYATPSPTPSGDPSTSPQSVLAMPASDPPNSGPTTTTEENPPPSATPNASGDVNTDTNMDGGSVTPQNQNQVTPTTSTPSDTTAPLTTSQPPTPLTSADTTSIAGSITTTADSTDTTSTGTTSTTMTGGRTVLITRTSAGGEAVETLTVGGVVGGSAHQGGGRVNAGAIGGGVAGGVVALIAAGVLVWSLMCRKKRSKVHQLENDIFEVDHQLNPYRPPGARTRAAASGSMGAGYVGSDVKSLDIPFNEAKITPTTPMNPWPENKAGAGAWGGHSATAAAAAAAAAAAYSAAAAGISAQDHAHWNQRVSKSALIPPGGVPVGGYMPVNPTLSRSHSGTHPQHAMVAPGPLGPRPRPPPSDGPFAAHPPAERTRRPPVHDEDFGMLVPEDVDSEDEEQEILPPMYNPQWGERRQQRRQRGARRSGGRDKARSSRQI